VTIEKCHYDFGWYLRAGGGKKVANCAQADVKIAKKLPKINNNIMLGNY